jgi:hypothetical protein
MLTYEELAPILHKYAYQFANQSGGKYTPHELINQCWLRKCYDLPDIKMAHARIRFDMIDYMRLNERRSRKFRITTITLDIKLFEPGYIQTYPIDLKDEIRHIIQYLSKEDRKICRMLLKGYTQTEIAEALKIPKGSLGYRMRTIRRLFREHFQRTSS